VGAKRCVTCHVVQPLDAFNRRASASDGRQARCRDCCKRWYVEHRAAHRAAVEARKVRVRIEYREWLGAYLLEHPCVDCGEDDIRVLDFDHPPGVDKVADVSLMLMRLVPWPRVLAEIEKCDVRCANCHRRRTAERGSYWRHSFMLTAIPRQMAEERRQALTRLSFVIRPSDVGGQPQQP
jgi:hypothetical protein